MARLSRNILPFHYREKPSNDPNGQGDGAVRSRPPRMPWLSNKLRNDLIAVGAEFIGTFMFLFFAYGGTQVAMDAAAADTPVPGTTGTNPAPAPIVLFYVSLAFGFSLMVNVWVFFRVSGGIFNPAVTLGLCLIGAMTPIRGALCFLSQLLASMSAAAVISALLPGPLLVGTQLVSGMSITRGLFLEMFLTSLLVFTIFMLAAEKHKSTFLAPVGIGLAFFLTELVGVYYTGGSLNPARSFAPCVVNRSFPGYHYIYWIGPLMGSLLAFVVYKAMKFVEYRTVNPGQEFDELEAALFHPPDELTSADQVERPNVVAVMAREVMHMSSYSSERRTAPESVDGHMSPVASGQSEVPLSGNHENHHG